jgi:hypothetical protein
MLDEEYVKALEEENEILRNKNYQDNISIENLERDLENNNVSPSKFLIKKLREKHSQIEKNHQYFSVQSFSDHAQNYGLMCNLGRGCGNTSAAITIIENIYDSAYICPDHNMLYHTHKMMRQYEYDVSCVSSVIGSAAHQSPKKQKQYEYNGNILTTLPHFEETAMRGRKFYCVIFDNINLKSRWYENIIQKLIQDKAVCLYMGHCSGF